jgi:hypothetical protein
VSGAIAVTRGCGRRLAGAIYAELGVAPTGRPVEDFLIDPPVKIDLDVAVQGVTWIERDGVWHMADWVGSKYYPNIADFVEEVRRFGLSRRIPSSSDFSRITPESRLLMVHSRAIIHNVGDYRRSEFGPYACPQNIDDHIRVKVQETCAGMWWEDIEGGEPDEETGAMIREMPAFTYAATARKEGIEPDYEPGFFASFPVGRLAIVNDKERQDYIQSLVKKTDSAKVSVQIVEE